MRFEFTTVEKIIFGKGTIKEVGEYATKMGKRALVVTGTAVQRASFLRDILDESCITTIIFSVSGEPTTDIVGEATRFARNAGCDFVVGFGGGSALDTGKAVAAMLTNTGDLFEYLEVIGEGKPLKKKSAPSIAIPTTAGTGTEVTRNAVLTSTEQRVKVSLRSPLMLPSLALVDPELTYTLPLEITASTGLDALTQVIEPYVSNQTNPLTDAICREGLYRAGRSLLRAYKQGTDYLAREDMSITSMFGGLALANAKLGAVHGFAGPIGGMFPTAPHGAVCGQLLPHVMAVNVRALRERAQESETMHRFNDVAQILTGNKNAIAEDSVTWIQNLCEAMSIPPLIDYGINETDFPELVEKAKLSSSMKGNPILLTSNELLDILKLAI